MLANEEVTADVPEGWRGGADSPAEAVARYRHAAASKTDRERQESRAKTGVVTGAVATNPATGASIPMFVADYVLMGYGTGAIMGVPGQDQRDWEFAEAFDVPIVRTVQPPEGFEGRGLDLLRLGSFIFRDRVRTGALGTYPVMSDRGLHS